MSFAATIRAVGCGLCAPAKRVKPYSVFLVAGSAVRTNGLPPVFLLSAAALPAHPRTERVGTRLLRYCPDARVPSRRLHLRRGALGLQCLCWRPLSAGGASTTEDWLCRAGWR